MMAGILHLRRLCFIILPTGHNNGHGDLLLFAFTDFVPQSYPFAVFTPTPLFIGLLWTIVASF